MIYLSSHTNSMTTTPFGAFSNSCETSLFSFFIALAGRGEGNKEENGQEDGTVGYFVQVFHLKLNSDTNPCILNFGKMHNNSLKMYFK